MSDAWLCPGCGTFTVDPQRHVMDCDLVDGAGRALPEAEPDDEAATLIDMDAVVAFVQMQGFFAYVEQTGGGCATIYAGPPASDGLLPSPGRQRGEPGTEDSRYAAVAGPGFFAGPGWTQGRGHRGDFYIGADDEGEGATTTITDESEERIAELIVAVIKEQP